MAPPSARAAASTSARTVAVADIGGTHARFALARVGPGVRPALGPVTTTITAAHPSLEDAVSRFAASLDQPLSSLAALAVAVPLNASEPGAEVRLANNPWTIRPAELPGALGIPSVRLLNDFESVAHAVAIAGPRDFAHICGPRAPLPANGVISVIGPNAGSGTGLGAAMLVRIAGVQHVITTEAGHIGFAPTDGLEDLLLTAMRRGLSGRVSSERLLSGAGLAPIHLAMGGAPAIDQQSLWAEVLEGETSESAATLERFLALFGGFVGDVALAQGASAVVIAGGLGQRLGERLNHPVFVDRFLDKGRFASHLARLPVSRLLLAEPGLVGAAAAVA
ncbi:glucokinase [Polymorphobacter sp.]|uniref:glucokinase n=1 Tax=Polymorphobacter sp. TaxID=1909290 RepID=UPI003F6EA8D0